MVDNVPEQAEKPCLQTKILMNRDLQTSQNGNPKCNHERKWKVKNIQTFITMLVPEARWSQQRSKD